MRTNVQGRGDKKEQCPTGNNRFPDSIADKIEKHKPS